MISSILYTAIFYWYSPFAIGRIVNKSFFIKINALMANSTYPNELPPNVASHLGLYCLTVSLCLMMLGTNERSYMYIDCEEKH